MTTSELIDYLNILDPEGTLEVVLGVRTKPVGVISREKIHDVVINKEHTVIWIKWSGI